MEGLCHSEEGGILKSQKIVPIEKKRVEKDRRNRRREKKWAGRDH